MSSVLDDEVLGLLRAPETIKVLTTTDSAGKPHSVVKGSLQVDESGNVIYLELFEHSTTNRNLVGSIWFDRSVSILLTDREGQSFQIFGIPQQVHVAGPVFQRYYTALRERLGDVELSGVWVIQPKEVVNQSWRSRLAKEGSRGQGVVHLDRLVRA